MREQDPGLAWLHEQKEAMQTLLLQFCDINSGSFHPQGNEAMAEALIKAYQALKVPCQKIKVQDAEFEDDKGIVQTINISPVLHWQKHASAPVQILLCGHRDTVFSPEHVFQTAKFLESNVLNAPGCADMKGGLVVMLFALLALERSVHAGKMGWQVLITADEEIGSRSSVPILANIAKTCDFGFVYEPALDEKGCFAGARKGSGRYSVKVIGQAAHVGRAFDKGRNAIVFLAKLIEKIDALNQSLAGVQINIGKIAGGDALNIVPDFAICYLDIRVENSLQEKNFLAAMQTILQEAQQEAYQVFLKGEFHRPAKEISAKNAELFSLLEEVCQENKLSFSVKPSGGCCDGNNLAAAGLANIDTLGVIGGHLHSSQEYMLINSLTERAVLSYLLFVKIIQKAGQLLC